MPPLDIADISGKAYLLAWTERAFFLKLALIPFLTKAIFTGVVLVLGYQSTLLRETLVMLPAYFMQGWMIAHIARFVFMDERGAPSLSGNAEKDIYNLEIRGRAIFAAIIVFVLITMLLKAFDYLVYAVYSPLDLNQESFQEFSENQKPSILVAFIMFLILFASIWSFKFFYVYIPVALDIPLKTCFAALPGIGSSIYLLLLWLIASIPFFLLGMFTLSLFEPLLYNHENVFIFVRYIVKFVFELASSALVTISFSVALKQILTEQKRPVKDTKKP